MKKLLTLSLAAVAAFALQADSMFRSDLNCVKDQFILILDAVDVRTEFRFRRLDGEQSCRRKSECHKMFHCFMPFVLFLFSYYFLFHYIIIQNA